MLNIFNPYFFAPHFLITKNVPVTGKPIQVSSLILIFLFIIWHGTDTKLF